MRNIRKFVPFIIIAFSGFLFLLSSGWFAETTFNPTDYARITDVDYKAVVVDEPGENGKIIVTERLTFDIHSASRGNPFWELWRDLPEEYIDGVKVDYKVNSVKQIMPNGKEVVYDESPRLYWEDYDYTSSRLGPRKWYHSEGPYDESRRQYECVFFYVDGLYRGEFIFEIEYEVNNAALRYNDSSELYLTLYSESSIKHLDSYNAQILFPNEIMPQKGNYRAYTYGTNNNTFPFTGSDSANSGYHTFMFDLDESQLQFKPHNQYIEFSLVSYGEDKHVFTQHASVNDYSGDDVLEEFDYEQAKYEAAPAKFKGIKIILLILSLIVSAICLIHALSTGKRIKKKHVFYKPEDPIEYFRDIPSNLDPCFAANLVFCKHKINKEIENGFSAVMLSLVRKKYIELKKIIYTKDWDFDNVKVTVLSYGLQKEPLSETEGYYFALIQRHGARGEITLKDFQRSVSYDYEYTNSFVRNVNSAITNIGVSQGYFQKADYQQPAKKYKKNATTYTIVGAVVAIVLSLVVRLTPIDLAFGAFIILGASIIASSIIQRRLANKYALLTQLGENEYAKWRGLYEFLKSSTLLNERTVIDVTVWEKYLVYATAFGISLKVIGALKVRHPNVEMSPVLRTASLNTSIRRSRSFHSHSSRSFRRATRSASFTSRSGGHGGYGGGGRGGGGGGGGH